MPNDLKFMDGASMGLTREVVRINVDGTFLIVDDITPEETLRIFPKVIEVAARLLKEKRASFVGVVYCPDCLVEALHRNDGAKILKRPYTKTEQCQVCKKK